LCQARLVFWDFDGVIKQSVEVKAWAFAELFRSRSAALAERVRIHHLANGGLSRFEKMPTYLTWAGIEPTPEKVAQYCQRFSDLALQGVVDAEWVPGAERLLRENPYGQEFVLFTATPQQEIEAILNALQLDTCFAQVHGAPTSKAAAIKSVLASGQLRPEQCLAIGDARADYDAACANSVPFLLRRHESNGAVFRDYTGDSIQDFTAS